MSRAKPKRTKAYQGQKYVAKNPMIRYFGGMSGEHAEHLQVLRLRNHAAMASMTAGTGTSEDWDLLSGAINMAMVMCEQGIGNEFRDTCRAGRAAIIQCGQRAHKTGRFLFTGDELRAMNEAMDCHDAQVTNVRSIDIDRASAEVVRRLKHGINTANVHQQLRDAA